MANPFKEQETWTLLVGAAKQALEGKDVVLRRMPGRGRSNIWETQQKGTPRKLAIRTTKDRWFAFPPLERGTKWKTLDDVDEVIVAAVDDPQDPKQIEVYRFDAAEVRSRFDAAYNARAKAGHVLKDDFGMWVNLDKDDRGVPTSVGAGLAHKHKPIAVYPIEQLAADGAAVGEDDNEAEFAGSNSGAGTIAEVVDWARRRIASLSGVRPEAVKLDLKIEY